jgi:hypothetical protein
MSAKRAHTARSIDGVADRWREAAAVWRSWHRPGGAVAFTGPTAPIGTKSPEIAAVELCLRTEELVERGILTDRNAQADAATLAELLDEGRARPATETQRQLCRRVDAALPAARVRASAALDADGLAILRCLARSFPEAVKLAELVRDKSLPLQLRSDWQMRRELQRLRAMRPPLAEKAATHGYHRATEAGVRRAKGR